MGKIRNAVRIGMALLWEILSAPGALGRLVP